MKDKIIELLLSTERKGIENLIQHMGENGFFPHHVAANTIYVKKVDLQSIV